MKSIFKKNKVVSVRINAQLKMMLEATGATVQQVLDEQLTRLLIEGALDEITGRNDTRKSGLRVSEVDEKGNDK